jgi:hypothetical protein
MRLVYGLVGTAALLFLVGGIGTIAAFVGHFDTGTRQVFMYIFLAGLVPTMALLVLAVGIGIYHLILYRVGGRTPTGWLSSAREPRP